MPAERLGRYTVLRHLASGGMADVLLARAEGIEGFERHVVLKRIRSEFAKDKQFISMFLDEARLAATLHHQNVVQVHDIGESAGHYFFAMEFIHGEDLRKIMSTLSNSKAVMPLAHVLSIGSAAAAGLHYAHERRGPDKSPLAIVHRDVSLSNIIVSYDGGVKVVDFGIAKATMRTADTSSGSLKGKVAYMSPEQCRGKPVDRRSDVYSLGVVLHELATTSRLFKGGGNYDMMSDIVAGNIPRPESRRPEIPSELSDVIMRALTTNPDERYQSAGELRTALELVAKQTGLTISPAGLASYMTELFGEKTEPWLEPGTEVFVRSVDAEPLELAAARAFHGADRKKPITSDGHLALPRSATQDGVEASTGQSITPELRLVTRTHTSKYSAKKLALFALPLLVIAIVAWRFAGHDTAASPPKAAELAPPTEPVTAPAIAPPVTPPTQPIEATVEAHAPPRAVPPKKVRPVPHAPREPRVATAPIAIEPEHPRRPDPIVAPPPVITTPPPQIAPPPVRLEAHITNIDVQGSLSQSVVKRAIERIASGLSRCSATTTGTLQVHFTIDESRRAQGVRGSGAPASVIGCVSSVFGGVRTESAPDVGDVTVVVQIALQARP